MMTRCCCSTCSPFSDSRRSETRGWVGKPAALRPSDFTSPVHGCRCTVRFSSLVHALTPYANHQSCLSALGHQSANRDMAANRVGRRYNSKVHSPSRGSGQDSGLSVQKRQARVTVKYNRKELQRRLDVEKWIDAGLDELYLGRVSIVLGGIKYQAFSFNCISLSYI